MRISWMDGPVLRRLAVFCFLWISLATGSAQTLTNVIRGAVDYPGERDTYSFGISSAKRFYFDALTPDSLLRWSLGGPSGTEVSNRPFTSTDGNNGNPLLELPPGNYSLTIEGANGSTNAYAFRLVDLAEAALITPGTVVSNNALLPRWSELYQFTAAAGDQFTFTRLAGTGTPYWRLLGPYGNYFFQQNFNNVGTTTLPDAGTYVLFVESDIQTTTTNLYSFTVNSVGNQPRMFTGTPLTFGTIYSGNFDPAGTTNAFTFSVPQPTWLLFDVVTNHSGPYRQILGPGGTPVSYGSYFDNGTIGQNVFKAAAGDYQLLLNGPNNYTNGYKFQIVDAGAGELITANSTVNGTLQPASAWVAYRVNLSAGQKIFFDTLSQSGFTYQGYPFFKLIDPHDHVIWDSNFADQGPVTLGLSGIYTVIVGGRDYETGASGSFSFRIVADADQTQALALNTPVTDAITQPGQSKTYTFTLPSGASISFDSISNVNNLRWSLTGPLGSLANNVGMNASGWWVFTQLTAGDYSITVTGSGDATNGFGFQVLDLGAAVPIASDSTVDVSLAPPSSTKAYRFSAAAGQTVYFDLISQSGFNYYGTPFWTLLSADGTVLFDSGVGDRGPFTFAEAGTYTLLVGGSVYESTALGSCSFVIGSVTDSTQSLTVGADVAGAITQPGQTRSYTFTLPAETLVSFDAITNISSIRWTLQGPSGTVANNIGMNSGGWFIYDLPAGDYTLSVFGSGDATGGYGFRLLNFSDATPIALDAPVTGSLVPASRTKAFRFNGTVGKTLYFGANAQSGFTYYGVPFWTLVSPTGVQVFDRSFGDYGALTLTENGTYTLLVGGAVQETSASGTYDFTISAVTNTAQTLTLGATVTGTIEQPGQVRTYSFTIPTATRIFFDTLTNRVGLYWSLNGPAGILQNSVSFQSDGYFIYPVVPGSYTLTVSGLGSDTTGDFTFRLLDFAAGTSISPLATVNGQNSPARSAQIYRFNASSGDRLFVDALSFSDYPVYNTLFWKLISPNGNSLFESGFGDRGPLTLSETGTYSLVMGGNFNEPTAPGSFSFRYVFAPDTVQSLPLNSLVSGSLTLPGERRRYSFTLPAAAQLVFDSWTNSTLRWSLTGSSGTIVNDRGFNGSDAQSFGGGNPVMSLPPGDYEVAVTAPGDAVGDFSFVLLDLASGTPLTFGSTTSTGLSPARSIKALRFTAAAGDPVRFDGQTVSGAPSATWRLIDPMGDQIWYSGFNNSSRSNLLNRTGTYTVLLDGYINDTADGSLNLTATKYANVPPPALGGTPIVLGQAYTNTLATTSTTNSHSIHVTSEMLLYFDMLNTANVRFSVLGANGVLVDSRYVNSGEFDTQPWVDLVPGDYEIQFWGVAGDYQVRFFDLLTAPVLALNTAVTNQIAPASGSVVYRLNVPPGTPLFYDGFPDSGFNSARQFRVYGRETGATLTRTSLSSDYGPFTLAAGQSYYFALEGWTANTGASATAAFSLHTPMQSTNALVLGATVQGTFDGGGDVDSFTFTLPAAKTIFFDGLTNNYWTWSLSGPGGTYVNSADARFSDSVDAVSRFDLPAGSYLLRAYSESSSPTDYAFRLLDAASATSLSIGATNSTNLVAGVGSAIYRFTGSAGQRVLYRALGTTGFNNQPYARLYSPAGVQIDSFGSSSDQPTITLPLDGDYLFAMEGRTYYNTTGTGFVSFAYAPVTYSTNALTIGATIQGTLDGAGDIDSYTFTLSGTNRLFFDSLTNSYWTWSLFGPVGTIVNNADTRFSKSADAADASRLLGPGTYVFQAVSQSTSPTPYVFRFLDPGQAFVVSLGTTNGTNLISGIGTALYRFNAAAGQRVYYDSVASTGFNNQPYAKLYNPVGQIIDSFPVNADRDTITLPLAGQYVLSIEGRTYYNSTGTGYVAFAYVPVTYTTNALALDAGVTNTISQAGTRHFYTFSLAASTRVFFDALTNSAARWSLSKSGTVISATRTFDNTDGYASSPSTLLLGPGDYQITVDFAVGQSGTYGFRLLTAASSQAIALNSVVTNVSSPSQLTRLYSLGATAGQKVYFDGLGILSGGGATPNIRLYSPLGTELLNRSVNGDQDTFVLPENGSYLVDLEGTFYSQVATQTTAFGFWANPDKPQQPLLETNASPDLIVTGVGITPPSGVKSGQSITVGWTVQNTGGAATASSFTDRVTIRNTATSQVLVNSTLAYDQSVGGAIPAGASRTRQLAVTLPDGTNSVGTLEIMVSADSANNILEQNAGGTGEANNSATATFNSTLAPYPDLKIAAISVTPPNGWVRSQMVTVSWVTTNAGTRFTSNSWSDRVVLRNLSTSQTLATTNVVYDRALPGNGDIAPAGLHTNQAVIALPNSTQVYGRFDVSVEADILGSVFEYSTTDSAETNNAASIQTISAPDLQITGLAVNPSPGPFSGATLNLSWQLTNSGNAVAESGFYDRVRVVNTDTADELINTTVFVGGGNLTNGTGRARSTSVVLPDGTRSVGHLSITVSADTTSAVSEGNLAGTGESNNDATAPLTTTLDTYPDLLVTAVSVEPSMLVSGTNMTIRWTLTNSGTGPVSANFYDRVVVVNTNIGLTLLNTSVYYSTTTSGPITNGTSRDRSYSFALPNNATGAGGLLVMVVADGLGHVFEYNLSNTGELNNTNGIGVTSSLTPLPDLAVTFISAPATAYPGVPFDVTYGLTNRGSVPAIAPWNDTVYLSSDDVVGFDQSLGSRQVTNTVPANGSITLTKSVVIPPSSEAGPLYLVVTADSGGGLSEANEQNNSLVSTNPVIVPGALSLSLSATQIAEAAANPIVNGTVTRNGSRVAALVVNLGSSDTTEATVPASVTIPAGQASATFPVTAQQDLEFDGPQIAYITASATGYDPATNALTVIDSNQRRVTISLAPTNVVEGASAIATITRDPADSTNLVVQLLSSDANQVSVPSTVVLSGGMASTNVVVTSVDDSLIERTNAYVITATANGHLPSSASVTVLDNDIPDVTLSLASRTVSEGAGPNATSGTVTLPSPRPRNIVILLQSSSNTVAQVPGSVTIPAGSISASFPVSAVNNNLVDGPKMTTIIGYVADSVFNQPIRPTTPDILTVTDDDGPTLKVTIADDLVPEGRSPATTAVVTRNTDTTTPLVVSLASDKTTEATVPASVTIPAGTNSATFNIFSVSDGITDGNQTVTISASATGYTTGSDTLVVSDADLPDIIVTDIAVATNGFTGQNLTVTFTLGNNGLRGVTTNITQRVSLSSDALLGADTIAAQPAYNGTLNVGDSIQQQATVTMPTTPGTYWIIVEADVFNAVNEVLENNNARITAVPIIVGPAYSATVQTAVTVSRANMPVPLTGHAVSLATGQAAPFVPVNVVVEVRGTRRTLPVATDAAGDFSIDFNPLPNEAGSYRIAATHPGVSMIPAWQDQFSILGFTIDGVGQVPVVEGSSNSVSTLIRNLSDQPLTGLTVEVYTNHPSIHVDAVLTNTTLAGDSSVGLRLDVRAIDTSATVSGVGVRVTTAEGVTNYLVFTVRQNLLLPKLAALPSTLQTTMLLGHQTPVTFVVTNGGGRASGPLEVLIPSAPWLSLSSPQQLPPMEPGSNTTVTLLLTPPDDLPLGDYTGTIAVNATNAALSVQYRFRTVSEGTGSLRVVAEDEYTYFTPDSPRLSNALVRVTDALSGIPVATNRTAADGSIVFTNLTEAYYIVDVSADAHSSYRQSALVPAGGATNVVAFLQRQTVNYTFTVVPTTVEDRYQFDVESTFETQVPIPVVTISPASFDLSKYPGDQFQVELTIENHGLIAANNVRIEIPGIDAFQVTPLITNIGTLGARQKIIVPAMVHRGPPASQNSLRQQTDYLDGRCSVTARMLWNYLCGPNAVDKENLVYFFDSTGCDLPALFNAIYDLVPIVPGGGGGGGPGPTIPADAGSNFAPPPGFKAVCKPTAPANIVLSSGGRPGVARSSRESVQQTADDNGVCARVKLKLSQQAVLTRDAFNATLEIDNETANPLSELLVTLNVQSIDGTNATDLFGIRPPQLVGITGVDGNGALPAFTTGSSSWILVPTLDAAPTNGARLFLVGGTMSYVQDGVRVTIPLAAAPIQVYPQPELLVRYFHDRDVFADDPFTFEIEPSLPYSLAVMVENVGYGEAKNLKITSGKPQIVENEKGLLIDFQILGAQLENQPISPALDVNMGSIGVGSNKIARWLFTSSLQGSFTNYSASFEHLDAIAGKRLSLVRSTEIHELSRIVDVDGALGDHRPDMLVNDIGDPQFLPDTLYLSQGPIRPVSAVTNASLSNPISAGTLQAMVTATMPTGWVYLRIGNPGGTNFVLKQVLRGDGSDLGVGTNAWTTDRFFVGGAIRPIRTNLLHLIDHNPGGTYTLVYAAGTNVTDITPPTTLMSPLPVTSPIDFTLGWTATDDLSGVAYFDVYVSTNGGPFGKWTSHITYSGAVFHGVPGITYAFYALATDAAGNAEPPPANAQTATAITTVVNQPPTLAPISDQSVVEGDLFTLTPTASDPDGLFQTLTFSLLPGTGGGAQIDHDTGFISWQTTGAHGGTTNLFTLIVADNGMPSLSATQTFRVRVVEQNTAPTVAPTVLVSVDEGSALGTQLTATDGDLPPQTLTWQLLSGGPSGLTVGSSGLVAWTPGEAAGPGTNFLSVRVMDDGFPPLSATQQVTVVVNEVNLPPSITQVTPKTAVVGGPLTVPIVATDPDVPANNLTYSLGAGAPHGARIDKTNGVFTWTPTPEYASTTVPITVRVADDGLPSQVSSSTFEVLLGDFMGLEIGSAVVITNETGSLPIRLTGTARVTNVTAVITLGAPVLASASVTTVPSALQGATLTPLGGNAYSLKLLPVAGGILGGTNPVAMFQFTTTNAGKSAFVPVKVTSVVATRSTGSAVDATAGTDGRLVFINREPLLELMPVPGDEVTLYGRPGIGYEIQTGSSLLADGWHLRNRIPLTNRTSQFSVIVTNGNGFFRALELGTPKPLLDLLGYGSGSMSLMVYGEPGASYDIQTSPDLVAGPWTTRETVNLTVGYREVTIAPPGGGLFFVRGVKK